MSKAKGQRNQPIAPWKHRVTEQRRKDAEERNLKYNALTPKQRIAKLDMYGHNAEKERAKLNQLMVKNK